MVIRLDVVVEQVVDSKTYFKFLVLEEFSANEQIAEVEIVIVSSFGISEVLEYERSGKCKSLGENPFQFSLGMMGDIVVGHLAELAAIVVHCIARNIIDSEVQLFADVAVESS